MAGNFTARQLSKHYTPQADCILACYSLNSERSFEELDEWIQEIRQTQEGLNIPIMLLATKSDLAQNERAVTENRGQMYKR